ncbi:MAG: division/cell wall cluster transcriptional repressor MraZ [Clostridia bacterium]|nr:division/cell wall cluster transcriptional repressor MraZ [Clostridia bacterium]
MLLGGSKHTVDAKGRLFFPARFKDELWENLTVCRGTEKCLMVFGKEEWEAFARRIKEQPFSVSSQLQRYFFSNAAEVSVDAQGRLLLPQGLRDFAGITKEVWVVGTQDRAEIWDIGEWERSQQQLTNDDVKSLMDRIGF